MGFFKLERPPEPWDKLHALEFHLLWAHLSRMYLPRLMRWLPTSFEADDVLMDTALRVFSHQGDLAPAKLLPYADVVAHRLVGREMKKRSRHQELPEDWDGPYFEPAFKNPEADEQLSNALSNLTPSRQALFWEIYGSPEDETTATESTPSEISRRARKYRLRVALREGFKNF